METPGGYYSNLGDMSPELMYRLALERAEGGVFTSAADVIEKPRSDWGR
jgi:hypothetical protein